MNTSKIIRGVVSNGRYTVTAPIVKEDYGLYLQIEGVELPSTYEVDFSNSENNGTSVTMIGNSDGVLIPRQFIETGKDVFAFLYHVGEDFGRTVYKFRIPNKVRPDRTNEEPTPEEQSVIDQAISALNEAVAQTAQDVQTTAQNVSASATNAQAALNASFSASADADRAEQSAINADLSATNASASATASAQSAGASAQSASEASQSAQSASASATASAQSATASANSATSAQGYAQSASASAQSASGYASNAQTSANTASTKAQDASGYAQTASQKATEASQSATNASQSAQTAEQAKTDAQTAQGLAEQARDTAVQAKTDAESARDDAESARDEAVNAVASISGALDNKADVITDTASGAVASFSDGADDLPLKSLVVNIDPVQDTSSGDPSPTNICPISGWTGMQLNVNGTVIPISWQSEAGTVYGGKLDVLSGVLSVDRAMVVYDGTEPWNYLPNYHCFVSGRAINDIKNNVEVVDYQNNYGIACHRTSVVSKQIQVGSTLRPIEAIASSIDEWKALLQETPLQIVYDLVTPIEIQLSPNQINSILGANNIFADTGDTACEYRADTKAWVQRKIAEAIASLT